MQWGNKTLRLMQDTNTVRDFNTYHTNLQNPFALSALVRACPRPIA